MRAEVEGKVLVYRRLCILGYYVSRILLPTTSI